jgi:hypothetical protein
MARERGHDRSAFRRDGRGPARSTPNSEHSVKDLSHARGSLAGPLPNLRSAGRQGALPAQRRRKKNTATFSARLAEVEIYLGGKKLPFFMDRSLP